MKKLFFLLLPLSFLYASSANNGCNSSIEMGSGYGEIDGFLKVGKDGDRIDLKKDLGLKGYKSSFVSILKASFKDHKFGLKTNSFKYSGKIKLDKDIIYNSEKFAKSALARSRYDLRWAKLSYRYSVNKFVSVGSNLNAIEIKNYINQKSSKQREFIPSLVINYFIPFNEELKFITKFSLTPFGKSRYSDFYGGIAFKLGFKNCSCLNIGYQLNTLHIKNKKFQNDTRYRGVYAGIKVGF